jgi:hypothetical protein
VGEEHGDETAISLVANSIKPPISIEPEIEIV